MLENLEEELIQMVCACWCSEGAHLIAGFVAGHVPAHHLVEPGDRISDVGTPALFALIFF